VLRRVRGARGARGLTHPLRPRGSPPSGPTWRSPTGAPADEVRGERGRRGEERGFWRRGGRPFLSGAGPGGADLGLTGGQRGEEERGEVGGARRGGPCVSSPASEMVKWWGSPPPQDFNPPISKPPRLRHSAPAAPEPSPTYGWGSSLDSVPFSISTHTHDAPPDKKMANPRPPPLQSMAEGALAVVPVRQRVPVRLSLSLSLPCPSPSPSPLSLPLSSTRRRSPSAWAHRA
jgi:hypothetical protein